ncbi:hypothetical protein AVEN_244968-1 [Araneus ventricosus]|uniref:Uncharacterized protein n=1 Tax=Araneus ventricosus TaxID=182803 RepID=A0A4Y2W6R9_ARAVE|nr:hypothetical protein AVEN_244968-1 [Araneus ventricosus]
MEFNIEKIEKSSSRTELTEKESVETVFEREAERWREKMIKVFGDSHPYNFFITYGHSDERHLKDDDGDISSRERNKSQPFERLHDMYEIDKKAEEEFHKILASIEDKADTASMNQVSKNYFTKADAHRQL